jgi:chorismate mutase
MSRVLSLLVFMLAPVPTLACDASSLFALVAERLAYMPAVAEYKHRNALPVSDPEREQRLLESATVQARALGLPTQWVLLFMRAQMEAARVIQHQLLQQWQQSGHRYAGEVDDLVESIRPQLSRLGRDQLLEIQCLRESGLRVDDAQRVSFDHALDDIRLPAVVADKLFRSLQLVTDH